MRAETLVATHTNTDFDAFAAMLAARRLYPGAVVCLAGSLNRNVREFYRLHADELDFVVDASRLELDAVRRLVVVETVHAARLGELEPLALDPAVDKVVFDHHGEEVPGWARAENVVISEDGALTTTLVGVLAEREVSVSPLEATVFALGIHEDTGSLTHTTTTQRDAEALGWCLRHGAEQEVLSRFLHTPLGETERELLSTLLDSVEPHEVAGIEVLVAAATAPEYVEGISNLAHKLIDVTDSAGLALLVEMDGRVFAVTRSRAPELDAAALAAVLGGGGHAQAASAIYRGPLDEARRLVVERLGEAVREPAHARDVMSKPARTIPPDETVSRAMVACQRFGQSGILVTAADEVVGAVSREDLDKAISHGLSHAPVKGIMSSHVAECDEDTPLSELQRLLAGGDERVAVLRDGKLVGVVTRGDVLEALGERATAPGLPTFSLADELARLERLEPVFEAVVALSGDFEGVYLVGGTVRDILLGERSFDVDIAVEGGAIALAQALADALGGRVRAHEKFGTAIVVYGDGERVDVVTARARGTIEMGLVGDLSSARLRDELVALLEEGEVEHSTLRLAELGADKAIHPHLAADQEAVALLARLRALARQYEVDVPAWRLGLIALARKLPPDEVYEWLQRLKVRRRDAEQTAAAVTVGPRLVERLRDRDVEPAEVVALADRYAPDAPLFALGLEDLEPLREYFRGLRDVRLEVTGNDLAELGLGESPRVGEILAELRRRKLNGELDGRDSELAAARELIGR